MICPLKFNSFTTRPHKIFQPPRQADHIPGEGCEQEHKDPNDHRHCEKEECAWWDEHWGMCCIAVNARRYSISGED